MWRGSVVLFCLGAHMFVHAQFGGPYTILAEHPAGTLLRSPGPLSRYMAFQHLAGGVDGSRNLHVTSILVDDDDSYWVGTRTGLLRLDGSQQNWYLHDPNNSTTLSHDHVNALASDDEGHIWVATSNGITRIDRHDGTMRRVAFTHEAADAIRVSQVIRMEYHFGKLWCSTWDGFFIVDPQTFDYRRILPTGTIDRAPFADGAYMASLVFPMDGSSPWIGSTDGILRLNPATGEVMGHLPADATVPEKPNMMFPAGGGRVWCYDRLSEGVYLMNGVQGVLDTLPLIQGRASYSQLIYLHDDGQGTLWLSFTDGQVQVMDLKNDRQYRLRLGPVADNVREAVVLTAMREDRRGRLWIGSDAGLIALLPAEAGLHEMEVPALETNGSIMCINFDAEGTLLVGTRGAGLRWRHPSNGQWHEVRDNAHPQGVLIHQRDNTIFDIAPLGRGRYMLATMGGTLLYDRLSGVLQRPYAGSDMPIRSPTVAAALAPDGRLWLGTMVKGLFEVDTATWAILRHFSQEDSTMHLPCHSIGTVRCGSDGSVWVGSQDNHGLMRMDPGGDRFHLVPTNDGLPAGMVSAIELRIPGMAMVSTLQEGLLMVDTRYGTTRRYTMAHGLPGTNLWSAVMHGRLGIWVGGREGVAQIDTALGRAIPIDLRLQRDHFSGVLGLDTTRQLLYIADGPRLLALDLTVPRRTFRGPRLAVQEARINGVPVSDINNMDLRSDRDRLVIAFSVQDPLLAHRTRVGYRLLPDTTWDDCTGCTELVFADLPPGDHTLEMKALDPMGQWGATTVAAHFSVQPPYWRTWWFAVTLLLVSIIILSLVFQFRLARRMAQLDARYESERALSQERLRIANDLHDELGSGLSVIKVKSELALDRPGSHPPQDVLRQVAASSAELIHAMRQMIWTIRSGQEKLSDLAAYMREYAVGYLSDHGIQCRTEAPGSLPDRQLSTDQRRALLLILKEALHNVVKHAQARSVEVRLSDGPWLTLRIADDGKGMDPQATNGSGLGLESMRRRAEAIGGRLRIEQDGGTVLVVEVPFDQHGPNVSW